MKKFVSILVVAALALFGVRESGAQRADQVSSNAAPPITAVQVLDAEPLDIPADLAARIVGFTSVTRWQINPVGAPADVFRSPDVLFAILDLDVQLPWVGIGEVSSKALVALILRSGVSVFNAIKQLGDPSGGPFHVGQYSWSHQTAPDFCSGEILDLMYFERTGQLFAFRFDNSHEC